MCWIPFLLGLSEELFRSCDDIFNFSNFEILTIELACIIYQYMYIYTIYQILLLK